MDVGRHPNIELITNSDVQEVSEGNGSFSVKIRRRPTYIDWSKCTGCGECTRECRLADKVPDDFNNRDYLRAIAEKARLRGPFERIVLLFEQVYFGRRMATPEGFQECLREYQKAFRNE